MNCGDINRNLTLPFAVVFLALAHLIAAAPAPAEEGQLQTRRGTMPTPVRQPGRKRAATAAGGW